MGANFNTMTLKGDMIRNEVKQFFKERQSMDAHDLGHSYSGGWNMATGLRFVDKTFDGATEAQDWLADNAEKWEDALCVTYKDADGTTRWMFGAWLAE